MTQEQVQRMQDNDGSMLLFKGRVLVFDLSADASLQRGLEQARAGQTVEAPDLGIDAAEFIETHGVGE